MKRIILIAILIIGLMIFCNSTGWIPGPLALDPPKTLYSSVNAAELGSLDQVAIQPLPLSYENQSVVIRPNIEPLVSTSNTTLGITEDGRFFTINGEPTFLLEISYFGALTLSLQEIQKDLTYLINRGFNTIRIWAYWWGTENEDNFSVLGPDGTTVIPDRMDLLKQIINWCDQNGMIVDLTWGRDWEQNPPYGPPDLISHIKSGHTLAQQLINYRNVFFDVWNEHSADDWVEATQVGWILYGYTDPVTGERYDGVKDIDLNRLCTASNAGKPTYYKTSNMIKLGRIDFIAPHFPRVPDAASKTVGYVKDIITWSLAIQGRYPVLLQEPFRNNWQGQQYPAVDFYRDATGGKVAEAAGWCLHNGALRYGGQNHSPWKCFDMRRGRLFGISAWPPPFNGLDDTEWWVVNHIEGLLGGTGSGLSGTSWKIRRYHPEFFEQLQHDLQTGSPFEWADNLWGIRADIQEHDQGLLTCGPWIKTLNAGKYKTNWRVKLDGPSLLGIPLVKISVYDSTYGTELASKELRAEDFPFMPTIDGFYDFELTWMYVNPNNAIEFRTYWYDRADIIVDYVDVIDLN